MDAPGLIDLHLRAADFDAATFPLGIIRLAPDGTVRYGNRALKSIAGDGRLREGMLIDALKLDPKSRLKLTAEMERRAKEGAVSEYDLRLLHDDGTAARCRIVAVPEYTVSGRRDGSLAFIHEQSLALSSSEIYREMAKASEPLDLLRRLRLRLLELVSFDCFMLTILSRDGRFLRNVEFPVPRIKGGSSNSPYRWWKVPAFVRLMLREFVEGPLDLDEMFAEPEFAALAQHDRATTEFRNRARPLRHALRLGIVRERRRVAVLSLMREAGKDAFTDADFKRCQRLPVRAAIDLALRLESQAHDQFALELVQDVATCRGGALDVGRRLVTALADHFKWEQVSVFQVDPQRRVARLLCQKALPGMELPADYEQNIDHGLLGRCVRTGKPVCVGDVGKLRKRPQHYVEGNANTRSELVLPLGGERYRWLLNIDSSHFDAFCEAEEQSAIERVLHVVGVVLDRLAVQEVDRAIMDRTPDVVIRTSADGAIVEVNAAMQRLLGHQPVDVLGSKLSSLVPGAGDNGEADLLLGQDDDASVMRLRKRDGSSVPMLVSAARLPPEVGGRVYIASDLTREQYLDRVGKLLPVFRALTEAMRIPLANAGAQIRRAQRAQGQEQRIQLLNASLQHLVAADNWTQQVLEAARATENDDENCMVVELRAAVEQAIRDTGERDALLLPNALQSLHVRAHPEHLRRCVSGLITYLRQVGGPGRGIRIGLSRAVEPGQALLDVAWADGARQHAGGSGDAVRALHIGLVLPYLMEVMGGAYEAPSDARPEHRLRLTAVEAA